MMYIIFATVKVDINSIDNNNNYYDYNLLHKKPIKVSKQVFSRVNSLRTQKYGNLSENEIPTLDTFKIGEERLNSARKYYVVNYDKYNFKRM